VGTHVDETGDIGTFIITGEGSAAAGIRRIEAITGREAYALIQKRFQILKQAAGALATSPDQVIEKIRTSLEDLSAGRKQIAELRNRLATADFTRVLDKTTKIGEIDVLTAVLNDADADTLRQMADTFRQNHPSQGVAVLATVNDGRPILIAAVTEDLVPHGIKAGDLAGFVARQLGGGGGGKPTLAQAGGKDPSKLDQALASVAGWVAERQE
jgi:alanyl-tRNA synthetase